MRMVALIIHDAKEQQCVFWHADGRQSVASATARYLVTVLGDFHSSNLMCNWVGGACQTWLVTRFATMRSQCVSQCGETGLLPRRARTACARHRRRSFRGAGCSVPTDLPLKFRRWPGMLVVADAGDEGLSQFRRRHRRARARVSFCNCTNTCLAAATSMQIFSARFHVHAESHPPAGSSAYEAQLSCTCPTPPRGMPAAWRRVRSRGRHPIVLSALVDQFRRTKTGLSAKVLRDRHCLDRSLFFANMSRRRCAAPGVRSWLVAFACMSASSVIVAQSSDPLGDTDLAKAELEYSGLPTNLGVMFTVCPGASW
eukprot:365228-Chlamydomonas_euryale.AAC.28